jgi:hypothetical protein
VVECLSVPKITIPITPASSASLGQFPWGIAPYADRGSNQRLKSLGDYTATATTCGLL